MTIENYFERRIRPVVEDSKEAAYKSTSTLSGSSEVVGHYNKNSAQNNNVMIDEDQLARTFQEIVNCINLDDDDEADCAGKKASTNFSRSNFHHSHHSLLPEFDSIFGGSSATFNIAVGSGDGHNKKSFLDDDWFPEVVKKSSEVVPIRANNVLTGRPMTPTSSASSSFNRSGEYFLRDGNSYNNLPPGDYVCKLCNCDGHWMKDCRLYEPRTPPSSISSFKSTSSSGSTGSSGGGFNTSSQSSSLSFSGNRTLLPPGNYVCRLCNVAGHWIDQCSKFQPKNESSSNGGGNSNAAPILPVMLGPGPTPNYRPPAYLSKPVPSNYICNLCNRPGHWIQQCTEFTPIINHKPHGINKY